MAAFSIHSPRAGRDRPFHVIIRYRNFNPLTSYEVKHGRTTVLNSDTGFNPLAPCGGETRDRVLGAARQAIFQSTRPVRGETE